MLFDSGQEHRIPSALRLNLLRGGFLPERLGQLFLGVHLSFVEVKTWVSSAKWQGCFLSPGQSMSSPMGWQSHTGRGKTEEKNTTVSHSHFPTFADPRERLYLVREGASTQESRYCWTSPCHVVEVVRSLGRDRWLRECQEWSHIECHESDGDAAYIASKLVSKEYQSLEQLSQCQNICQTSKRKILADYITGRTMPKVATIG